jgi:uncharacterized protein
MGDNSWMNRPKWISDDVLHKLVERINRHCQKHELERFHIEFHGGEPLAVGLSRFSEIFDILHQGVSSTRLTFSLQTNGLLLDQSWVDCFSERGIGFGVSIDPPVANRAPQRLDFHGRDTTDRVLNILRNIDFKSSSIRWGALTVVDQYSPIRDTVKWFSDNGIISFDLRFPIGNYQSPPFGVDDIEQFAKNVLDAYHFWRSMGSNAPRIRLFEELYSAYFGKKIVLDYLGGDLSSLCVIESDGSIGINDVGRLCGGDWSKDTLSIMDAELDEHAEHYMVSSLQRLSHKCSVCEFRHACGGGYLPERYDGKSFENPTIYCSVYKRLCSAIEEHLSSNFPGRLVSIA